MIKSFCFALLYLQWESVHMQHFSVCGCGYGGGGGGVRGNILMSTRSLLAPLCPCILFKRGKWCVFPPSSGFALHDLNMSAVTDDKCAPRFSTTTHTHTHTHTHTLTLTASSAPSLHTVIVLLPFHSYIHNPQVCSLYMSCPACNELVLLR